MTTRVYSAIHTLDARWLEYVERTRAFYEVYPALLPLRQTIFKNLIERKQTLSLTERAKVWASPALKRQSSTGTFDPVDVVLWLDQPREVLYEPILSVQNRLQTRGVKTALITTGRVRARLDGLVTPTVELNIPQHFQSGGKWRRAWADLHAALGEAPNPASYPAFLREVFLSEDTTREVERVLRWLKPRLIVMPVDQFVPGSTACLVGRDMGIKSLVLLHGAVNPYNTPITADRMAVWGAVSQDQMLGYGVPADQLVALGSPRHDRFPTPVSDARAQFQRLFELRDLPIFVFFSNGNDLLRNSREACEGCATWLNAAAEAFDGKLEFVVRLHPNEDGSLYTPYPKLKVMKNECDLNLTISAADICGALCSTTLVDTLLYRKPVLQFYDDRWVDLADNWRRGLAERVTSPTHLIDLLRAGRWEQIVAGQSARAQEVFANYPHAADAVAAYIREQL